MSYQKLFKKAGEKLKLLTTVEEIRTFLGIDTPTNIYSSNGTISGNRIVYLDSFTFSIAKGASTYFHLFNNGNLWLGNGIPADLSYKLFVNGITGFSNITRYTGPLYLASSSANVYKSIANNGTNIVIGGHTVSGTIQGDNILIGYRAGDNLNSLTGGGLAANNTFIGNYTGIGNIVTGGRNLFIGNFMGSNNLFPTLGNVSNKLLLGAGGSGAGSAVIGGDILLGCVWINPNATNMATPDASVAFGINPRVTGVGVNTGFKGFLPPTMTALQAESIVSPAEGLLLYATDGTGSIITSKGWWGYDGATWVKLN